MSLEEAQELVNKYAGTGRIQRDRNGRWIHKEKIVTDKIVGIVVNLKGEYKQTKSFTIHYSKQGTHIVPAKEDRDD